jgi:hypothetical protein
MAASLDEGVVKLEAFCALLAAATSAFAAGHHELQECGDRARALDATLGESLAPLDEALSSGRGAAQQAMDEAEAALHGTRSCAHQAAERSLRVLERSGQLRQQSHLEIEAARGELRAGVTELQTAGFDPLAALFGLEEGHLEEGDVEADTVAAALESSLDRLVGGLEELGRHLADTAAEGAQAVADGAGGLHDAAGGACPTWPADLQGAVSPAAEELADDLEAAYAEWSAEARRVQEELIASVEQDVGEQVAWCEAGPAAALSAQAAAAFTAAGALHDQRTRARALADSLALAVSELEPLAAELQIVRCTIHEITRLLQSVGP